MLVVVWSLGLFFTAIITSTLSRTVKGQVILLKMMAMSKLVSCTCTMRTFDMSPLIVVFETLLVLFVKFEPDVLATLRLQCAIYEFRKYSVF